MRKVVFSVSGIFILLSAAYSAYYHYARSADLLNPFDTRWGLVYHCVALPLLFVFLGVFLSAAFFRRFQYRILRHVVLWCGVFLVVAYACALIATYYAANGTLINFIWEYGEVSVVFLLLGGMIGSFFAKE